MINEVSLSSDQEKEFTTPLLQALAKSYIAFRKSSPCTPFKPRGPYFDPPASDEMDEYDVLYGESRQAAYDRLMRTFRRCQRDGELTALFKDDHKIYYKSETVPSLTLLRKWLDEKIPAPGVYGTASAFEPDMYDVAVAVGTNPRKRCGRVPDNVTEEQTLYPSKDLMSRWYDNPKDKGCAEEYLRELLRPEPLSLIRKIAEKSRSESVIIFGRPKSPPYIRVLATAISAAS